MSSIEDVRITVDYFSNCIYLGGITTKDLYGNVNNGNNDIILIKFQLDGERLWERQFGSEKHEILIKSKIRKKTE